MEISLQTTPLRSSPHICECSADPHSPHVRCPFQWTCHNAAGDLPPARRWVLRWALQWAHRWARRWVRLSRWQWVRPLLRPRLQARPRPPLHRLDDPRPARALPWRTPSRAVVDLRGRRVAAVLRPVLREEARVALRAVVLMAEAPAAALLLRCSALPFPVCCFCHSSSTQSAAQHYTAEPDSGVLPRARMWCAGACSCDRAHVVHGFPHSRFQENVFGSAEPVRCAAIRCVDAAARLPARSRGRHILVAPPVSWFVTPVRVRCRPPPLQR
jgi:hypothetical protein